MVNKLRAISVSFLNLLYFLLVYKNISYVYQDVFFRYPLSFIILLKLSFIGFSLGLLLSKVLYKLNINKLSNTTMISIGLAVLINYVQIHMTYLKYIISFLVIFIPSLLFGFLFANSIKKLKVDYSEILFYLLIGSTFSAIFYNYFLVYLAFPLAYLIIFLIFTLIFIKKYLFVHLYVTIIFIMIAFQFHNFGQIDPLPLSYDRYEHIKTVMGPYGILDIIKSPSGIIDTLSDKVSPSHIAIKGNIQNIQEHVIIPYQVKNYNTSLIIGFGGGQDLVAALYYNTANITALEIDKQRISLLKNDFREYSNNLLFDLRLNVVADSAGSFLRDKKKKFDLIVIQRPWTEKIINSYFYDTSGELFTQNALDKYLDSITDEGVIFWGLPLGGSLYERYLYSIKNRMDILENNLLIFTLNENNNYFLFLMSKNFSFSDFYQSNKNIHQFYYYPGITEKNNITKVLFSREKDQPNIDRQINAAFLTKKQNYGLYSNKQLNKNLILILIILLATLIIFNNSIQYSLYFYVGLGYEIILLFLILWLPYFISNFIKLMPIVLIIYYLFGSIGYLVSKKLHKTHVLISCLAISLITIFILQTNLLYSYTRTMFTLILIILIFIITSFIITFPFGYLIVKTKKIYPALFIDYIGSVFSLFVIVLIPNLDYLLILSLFILL